MSTDTPPPPAGWYPDPQGGDGQRWWDGTAWTQHTQPAAPAAPPTAAPAAQPAAPVSQPAAPATPSVPLAPPAPSAPPAPPTPAPPAYAPAAQQYAPAAQQYPPAAQTYPGAAPAYSGAAPYAPGPPIGSWRSHLDDRPLVTGMGSAIRTVFHRYARFEGRAARPEYWYWVLFNAIIVAGVFVLMLLTVIGIGIGVNPNGNGVGGGPAAIAGLLYVLLVLWGLAVIVPNLAVLVRRLRDGGFHWALVFLGLIPGGWIALLVLASLPSKYP